MIRIQNTISKLKAHDKRFPKSYKNFSSFYFECFFKYQYQYLYGSLGGIEIWTKNGLRHRDNRLPAVVYSNGKKLYYCEGSLQRYYDCERGWV